jgi:hypothetical protein
VQVLDTTGAAVREFGVVDQPAIARDDDIARAESVDRVNLLAMGVRPEFVAPSAALTASHLREKPRYRGVRADDSTVVAWEQEPAELGDGPASLHVFTAQGIYLSRIETTDRWIDFDLHGDRIVALAREPDAGLAYAVAYRLVIPEQVRAGARAAVRP